MHFNYLLIIHIVDCRIDKCHCMLISITTLTFHFKFLYNNWNRKVITKIIKKVIIIAGGMRNIQEKNYWFVLSFLNPPDTGYITRDKSLGPLGYTLALLAPPCGTFNCSMFYKSTLEWFLYRDILWSIPKRSKWQIVSKLGCRVVFLKYPSM